MLCLAYVQMWDTIILGTTESWNVAGVSVVNWVEKNWVCLAGGKEINYKKKHSIFDPSLSWESGHWSANEKRKKTVEETSSRLTNVLSLVSKKTKNKCNKKSLTKEMDGKHITEVRLNKNWMVLYYIWNIGKMWWNQS